jgi:outer membrane autotransporter protein
VNVTGNATLEGGTIRLDVAPGLYEQPTTYTLLTASNIAGVGFTNVAPDFAFLDVTLGATGGTSYTIDIEANFSSITQFAVTPNQASTAIAMEEYFQSPDPDVTEVRRSFTVLTVPQVPAVLDQLAGGTLSAFTNGRLSGAQYFSQAVSRRFTSTRFERRSKDASQLLRQVKSAAYQPGRAQQGFGAWVEPFGVFGSFSNQKNALPITSRFYGFVAGLDYRFPERFPLPGSEHVRLGLAAGYASQTVKSDPELMEGDGNAYQVGLYGAYDADRFHVGGALRYGASDMSTERKIAFEGLYRRARAEFNGQAVSALVETGLRLGDPRKLLIHPIAGFQYTHLTQDPFIETGAGTLSLAVLGQQVDSMVTTLGGGLSRIFTLKGEYGTEPELRFGWAHEFGDIDRNVTGRFYQIGGSTPFVTSGAEPNRNNFWIGAGYTMSFGDRPLLAVHYDAILGSNQTRHVLSGGLYLRW